MNIEKEISNLKNKIYELEKLRDCSNINTEIKKIILDNNKEQNKNIVDLKRTLESTVKESLDKCTPSLWKAIIYININILIFALIVKWVFS